ncbi:MAG: Ig domain-containing protein [Dehalococcoidia bacterium]
MVKHKRFAWILPILAGLLVLAVAIPAGATPEPLAVTTASLSIGEVNAAYENTLTATGGTPPYSWSLTGGVLPTGLTLNSTTGAIAGTPTVAGDHDAFTVTVADAAGETAAYEFSMFIASAVGIDTTALPNGELNVAYSHVITVSGGAVPYVWSVSVGSLPAGLSLGASTGVISGTPTATGTASFTVSVEDGAGGEATQALTIVVAAPVAVVTTEVANATLGAAYAQTLAGAGGVTAYSWSLQSGALPTGLTLNTTTGAITGTPTAAGSFTFTVLVTDMAGGTASQELSMTVAVAPALGITTIELPKAKVGAAYSYTLTATGGVAPRTWSLVSGTLPSGLSLGATTGTIAGTPTQKVTATFAVKVTDATGATAASTLVLSVTKSGEKPAGEFDAKVLASCDASIDAHPALSALCGIYAGGKLGMPAQHIIGRVILKLSDRHESKDHAAKDSDKKRDARFDSDGRMDKHADKASKQSIALDKRNARTIELKHKSNAGIEIRDSARSKAGFEIRYGAHKDKSHD